MTPARKIPENVYETPTDNDTPDRPSGSWPRRIEDAVDAMGRDIHDIKKALVGTVEQDGLASRVRKLEDDDRGRKKVVAFAVFGTLTAIGTAFWNVITGKAHP